MLLLGRKGKGEEEKERRKDLEALESFGWGRNPTTAMDETKRKAQSKTQAEK